MLRKRFASELSIVILNEMHQVMRSQSNQENDYVD